MDGGAKRPLKAAALDREPGAAATADVGAAARQALLGVRQHATLAKDHTPQIGLCRERATADAAPAWSGYEVAPGSSASSAATAATVGSSSGAISSVGWFASAWWESRPQ